MPDISNWAAGLFVPNRRTIGGIVAQVTIREMERDELQITEHPVEQGAPISDHAFKRPSEVQIRAGWSASKSGNLSASGGIYGQLLGWQAARIPFDLHTGKRVYKDMLMQSLTVTTDQQSEFTLMADITCRQVIIVATKTTDAKAISQNPDNQKNPEKNGASSDKGEKESRNVNTSDYGGSGGGENTSDYSGGERPASESSDVTSGDVYGGGEGPGTIAGPESTKVDATIAKNDPNGVIVTDKLTARGQTLEVPISPAPDTRIMRLRPPQPLTMRERLRRIGHY